MIYCELSSEEISQIVGFLGYGPHSADVWFIGMEEGLGGMSSTDTCKNLKARATFERTMDLRTAHLRLLQGGMPIDVEKNTPSTQVWQFMAKIMLARDGKEWRAADCYKKYVQFSLGRIHGETFLTELSPIPSKNSLQVKNGRSFSRRKIQA